MYEAVAYGSLGEAILLETLRSAYYALTKHPIYKNAKRYKEGSDDLVFIQNDSGIHQIITIFDLYLDPNKVQNLFFYYVEVA